MSLAAVLFALATVAFLAHSARGATLAAALLAAAAAIVGPVQAFGAARGLVVFLLLAMTAASLLVLLLPPRPRLALPLALTAAGLGGVAAALEWLT